MSQLHNETAVLQMVIDLINLYSTKIGSPLSEREINALGIRDRWVRSLLAHLSSFTMPCLEVDITGGFPPTDWPQLGELVVADDGTGNLWTVDVDPVTREWGCVFHLCHDPPMFFRQCHSFSSFMLDIFTNRFLEDTMKIVYRLESQADLGISTAAALESPDPVICQFANSLTAECVVYDLRGAPGEIGFDHSSGEPSILRHVPHLVFATEIRHRQNQGWWWRR